MLSAATLQISDISSGVGPVGPDLKK